MPELAKQLGLLALVLVVIALVLTLFGAWPSQTSQVENATLSSGSQLGPNGVRIPPPQPPPTPADTVAAQQGENFQLLVSYVDTGFEPQTATIKAGETVRFTNNSTEELWVASDDSGAPLYPHVQNGCGASALDSCQPLDPGQYWQFTFTQKGTWSLVNNLEKSSGGTITVTVQ
jgi:plastocyanin